jgi:peptide/nickel transport system permease protein
MFKFVILSTDVVLWALVAGVIGYGMWMRGDPQRRANWVRVFREPSAMSAAVVFACFAALTMLDSVHFRRGLATTGGSETAAVSYSPKTESLLDLVLAKQIAMREKTYSAPLAAFLFSKETVGDEANAARVHPRLTFAAAHLTDPATQRTADITMQAALGAVFGLLVAALGACLIAWRQARSAGTSIRQAMRDIARNDTDLPWRAAAITWLVICVLAGMCATLMQTYHVLGTDRTGNDVFVQALKSVRTAFVIGTLATVATLPIAIVFGVAAGYFKGWIDDVITYVYTTLSSIPSILLIAACVLMAQVFLDKNPDLFETGLERADFRIFILCLILGLTSWASLCRLIRAETLKLRELDYVQAANAFGVSHVKTMARHILPNVMHLVLITTVLSFSELVLYEAVLSYVGVGVDPSMNSFGGMINQARGELSRDPIVWWSFASAFGFMVVLVLAANLFADGIQQAFDPRARTFRVRLAKTTAQKA